jgi:hypothetical protein
MIYRYESSLWNMLIQVGLLRKKSLKKGHMHRDSSGETEGSSPVHIPGEKAMR